MHDLHGRRVALLANSGRSSRLGRVLRAKHEKSSKNRSVLLLINGSCYALVSSFRGRKKDSVKLLSVDSNKEIYKRKTGVVKGSVDPVFDNHFEFDVDKADIQNYRLRISVKDDTNYGAFSAKPVIGQVSNSLEALQNGQDNLLFKENSA
ncbi:unnamed protein product [Heligmosomoides polygyrus]|uniref:C2 domain-containing protein n=1 Tax=Heligmosomoides polygyrus TaxID=6339 RepID=A0A3P8EGU2_HELPZ|nr:unnamed protein product [Heligmosomoides polygyrus]